jgi:type VI secretion system secreted protein VgrG
VSILELSFACGESSLSVRRVTVHEGVSTLFDVAVLARSEEPSLDLERIVGKKASLHASDAGRVRTWEGVCSYIEQVHGLALSPGSKPLSTYHLRIVPDVWLMNQRRGYRVHPYQHVAIPDIIDKLLGDWGIAKVWRIARGTYPKLEYKVQYGETDYNFLCRLAEEAGIAFTFPDDEGSKITFNDKLEGATPRASNLRYVDNSTLAHDHPYVTDIRLHHVVRPGAYTLRDYDFRKPSFPLFGEAEKAPPPEDFYEQYLYDPHGMLIEGGKGGDTPFADDKGVARHTQSYGTDQAQRGLDGERVGKRGVSFESNVVDLWPGVVVGFDNHPHAELAERVLVTSLRVDLTYDETWHVSGDAVFSADPYRPLRRTPKPQAHGVQSATVVGPPGEEIHVDEFGRVRVQFPWDREGTFDDDSSCWMRVSQGWAGTAFGMINLPRVGQEVLVGFLDGDPDAPIVVGRVFNAIEQVPYKLPDNKTVSGWKTNSSPGGGGYNEIKLEDKKSLELIYIQAQRNLDKLVKNDETERTLHDHKKTVVHNQDLVVKAVQKTLVQSAAHLHVEADRMEKIDGTTSLIVGVDRHEKVTRDHAHEAGRHIHIRAGDTLVVEAGARLTVRGPAGFIDFHSGGIDIEGTIVRINSGGSPAEGVAARPVTPEDAVEAVPKDSSPP